MAFPHRFEENPAATQVGKYIVRLIRFIQEDPHFTQEEGTESLRFFGEKEHPAFRPGDLAFNALGRFIEWFIFDCKSQHYGKTLLDVFLERNPDNLPEEELEIYRGFKRNIYFLFEVKEVVEGRYLILQDLVTDVECKALEFRATFELREGDIIVGRLFPWEGDYVVSLASIHWPKEVGYLIKRRLARIKEEGGEFRLSSVEIEKLFQEQESVEETLNDLEKIRKRLKDKLHEYLGKKVPSLRDLERRIDEYTDPQEAFKDLIEGIIFPSKKEFKEFQELLFAFWNYSPRKELGGISPMEKSEESPYGPMESMLIEDLIDWIRNKFNPEQFPDPAAAQTAIERLQQEWLNLPQKELDYRTPLEIILEEREKLGNPRKDFSIKVTFSPSEAEILSDMDLTSFAVEDTPLVHDFEAFLNYFQDQRIKVTPKQRYIPFKHLKLIEREFIYKDGFIFSGKEEQRGEERFKHYIWFIDWLARRGGFIEISKEGAILLNEVRWRNFQERSYGEKLFELFKMWIEDVNWKVFQREHLAPYCDEYRENIDTILYHLEELKVDVGITVDELLFKFYKSKKAEIKRNGDLKFWLELALRFILIRYLKWLGIIKTIEEPLLPEEPTIPVSKVKFLWITSKGKRLVNRMIHHRLTRQHLQNRGQA